MIERSQAKSVAVVGCGYVGYPLALLIAAAGHIVRAVDTDPAIAERITAGGNLSHEPGISELAREVKATGRLTAHTKLAPADVFVIAVPTPLDSSGHRADLSAVREAGRSVAKHLQPGNLVVVESTVPPGTTRTVVAPVLNDGGLDAGVDFHLAHCPERVFPGNTIAEMRSVARVIGGIDDASTRASVDFFATFVEGTITTTSLETAELVKLLENTYRDVNIALTNQVAMIASQIGVNPAEAISIANQHPRVSYLEPGIGVGGHCLPVDPWFLPEDGTGASIIEYARNHNNEQPSRVAESILAQLEPHEESVLLLGAAYKPDVADTRNSPALAVRDHVLAAGINAQVYDPLVPEFADLPADHTTAVLLVAHTTLLDAAQELADSGVRVLDGTSGSPQKSWHPNG